MLKGRTRETKIHRDAAGRWFNEGQPITHELLTQAFDAWLRPAPDGSGRWCLSNDINWAYVSIDGPPRFVRRVEPSDDGVRLHLSDGTATSLDPSTLRQDADGALYCDVPGGMVARFDSHAAMQLSDLVDEDERGVFVTIGGERVRPPVVDDPLRSA
ncbi:MAG TPA: hypothetical protein RMH99_05555 [Sandaracinaceae bacterium LLY-WYZ-13_1]|nr:hypothetical protein [Sandaracinaceae bacterium LLY-WYZ-13_1]